MAVQFEHSVEAGRQGRGIIEVSGLPISRIFSGFAGVVLLLAAAGMWLVPSAEGDGAMQIMKMGVTILFAGAGAMLLSHARQNLLPEVLLDPVRGRLVVSLCDARGVARERIEYSYDELSDVDFRGRMLIATDHHGRNVIELPLERVDNIDELRAALGPEFARRRRS